MRRAVGWLCAAAPFVAGAIAALSARRDFRILAMAVVSTVLAWVVVGVASRRGAGFAATAAFLSASAAAAGVAVLAGARSLFGVIAVAIVVAAFATAGAVLGVGVDRRLSQ